MMKNIIVTLLAVLFVSCQTKKINQYIKSPDNSQKRHGKWIEEYPVENGTLVGVGKYKNGEKIGVWRTTFHGKKYQKDKIRKSVIKTKFYHPNGKIMQKGKSRLDISDAERHWYYFGKWKYFDEKGKLERVRNYGGVQKNDSISLNK